MNANTILQGLARVFRIGQQFLICVWLITVDATYDQVLQARAARKYIGQLASNLQLDREALFELSQIEDEDVRAVARKEKYKETAQELYRLLFGQRSQRHFQDWAKVTDLDRW